LCCSDERSDINDLLLQACTVAMSYDVSHPLLL
jgi:hypothetical protein